METIDQQHLEDFLKTPHQVSPQDKVKIQDTILSHLVTTFWNDKDFLKRVNQMTYGLIKDTNNSLRQGY